MIENRTLWSDAQVLTFDAPELARAMRPGQFALVRDPTTLDPYLRRTTWLYQIEGEHVALTLSSRELLVARARPGDTLDLLAPLGRAIEFDASARHIVLVGEGTRVAPLVAVAHNAIEQGCEVVLATRAASPPEVFPAHLLSAAIEYRTGSESLNAELIAWTDAIVASGSDELYRALADAVRAVRFRIEPGLVRVLIDRPMPCGTGACYACAVETQHGIRLACTDGPSFDLIEFENEKAH